QTYVLRLEAGGYALIAGNPTEHGQPAQAYRLPDSMECFVRSPADADFHRVSGLSWYFAPNGLCEPMAFLFQQGGSWVRFRIDPLTARIQDRQSFIP
ncbi:MAG: hypothetical protein JO069_02235, partial [Verrucomicrobia bacterium]|nr:hypothetical protein [Verrucomicrobiota bacterium]